MGSAQFDSIRLIWRPRPHTLREVVGTLRRLDTGYSFRYDGEQLDHAKEAGFKGYPGMADLQKDYNGQAMGSFTSRLPGRERTDFERLLRGWGASPELDDFELLGLTFGRLPTDMYEFIPEIKPVPGTRFHTDLAGIENYAKSAAFKTLPPGTPLELRPNPENEHDRHAVEVLYEGQQAAHVKRIHCDSVFAAIRSGLEVECRLVRVRVDGAIQEVVVEISYRLARAGVPFPAKI